MSLLETNQLEYELCWQVATDINDLSQSQSIHQIPETGSVN